MPGKNSNYNQLNNKTDKNITTRGNSGNKGRKDHKDRRPKNKGIGRVLLKTFKISVLLLIVLIIVAGAGIFSIVYSYVKDAPDFNPQDLNPAVTSYIFDNQGNEITSLYDEQNRIEILLESVPQDVQNAFIAIEDERFYEHYGVDPTAITRAFYINLRQREWTEQGGSTITQQLIKNAFLTPEKTFRRKIQEAWLSLEMERQYSKNEILELYLNQIYFAQGAYGIEAASNTYFNKSTDELSVAEAAMLAGIPRSPNYYSPFNNYEIAVQRQSQVLQKMLDLGFISDREYNEAMTEEIALAEIPSRDYPYPYFIDYVIHHELVDILIDTPHYSTREEAYEAIYNMGLKVHTTLDVSVQTITEEVINDENLYPENWRVDMTKMKALMEESDYSSYPEEVLSENGIPQPQGAGVVANPVSGEVLALVGGREYSKDNQDLRYLSRRQPGSAIKPVTAYAPAMEEGLSSAGSVVDDSPFIRGSWAPENFDRNFSGLVTVREALVRSLNVPAVKTFLNVTPEIGLDYASKMGLSTIHPNDYNLSTTLGGMTYGVTAFDMAQSFAVFANQGIKVEMHTISKIEDRKGEILYERRSNPEAVLSEETAFLMNDILKDVVRRGTAARLDIGRPVAAKTGTTSDNRDAYLVAYTPDTVVSFWMGHDIQKLGRISGGSGTTIPFMNQLLSRILEGKESSDFQRPSGITGPISICSKSGLRLSEHCPSDSIINELFPAGMVPQESCDMHVEKEICTSSGLLSNEFCPENEIETKIFLNRPDFERTDGRWRGASGRGPADAGLIPPTETCDIHTTPPPVAEGFSARLLDNPLRAHFSWDPDPEAVEFKIYRRIEGEEDFSLARSFASSINEYKDNTIEPGTVYIYQLISINADGIRSAPSELVVRVPSDTELEQRRPPPDRSTPPGQDEEDEDEEEDEEEDEDEEET